MNLHVKPGKLPGLAAGNAAEGTASGVAEVDYFRLMLSTVLLPN